MPISCRNYSPAQLSHLDRRLGKLHHLQVQHDLVAALGKAKADVRKAYKSSGKKDVEIARVAVKELVGTAERKKNGDMLRAVCTSAENSNAVEVLEFAKVKKTIRSKQAG